MTTTTTTPIKYRTRPKPTLHWLRGRRGQRLGLVLPPAPKTDEGPALALAR